MKSKLFLILGILIVLGLFFLYQNNKGQAVNVENIKSIKIGNTLLSKVDISDTPEKRERGLSYRSSIGEEEVMLFIFKSKDVYAFWMKDMSFPIDMIWLDENFKVVGLKSDAKPESYPEAFYPEKPALYVLETKVGVIEKENLKIGDRVLFQ